MFAALARFDIRFRWLILLVWIVAVVAAVRLLPGLSSVSQANNGGFLAADAPSLQAGLLAAPFQGPNAGATAVIVGVRSGGPITAMDEAAIVRLEQAASGVPGVAEVRDEGTSADGHAHRALVVTAPSPGLGNAGNPSVVDPIRQAFGNVAAPAGLEFHLTGPLAQATDATAAASQTGSNIRLFTVLFIIVLLVLVYRSVLGPVATLVPAIAALVLSEPLIAQAAQAGLPVSPATATLLPVLLLGAGADYGVFLVFRVREEVRRGAPARDALVAAMARVGESITFSALTVVAALCCLLVASFDLYRGLGPSLAIGVAVLLLAALTLLPSLLAIFGGALFWPAHPAPGQETTGVWGRLAVRVVGRPVPVLLAGVVLFAVLAAGLVGFRTAGFTSSPSRSGSDSATGAAVLAAHFPAATANAESLVLRFATSVWDHPDSLALAAQQLTSSPELSAVSGPTNPNGTSLTPLQLSELHAQLGPAQALPAAPPTGTTVAARLYQAYRATTQFISPDGRTVQFYGVPSAGAAGSRAAVDAVPALRAVLATVAQSAGASASGVAGLDAVAHDIDEASTQDLAGVAPVVLVVIGLLLAVLLRSLVAPLYLIATVGLSYLAALGFATTVFVHFGGGDGLNFIIPILLFIFVMALGEDYNILLMTRVREEAGSHPLREAVTRAVGRTGGTITSAGLILAGTFTVLAIVGNSDQARQLGFTIAFGVLLDTFFVRTLLVPSIAVLLGRWNWWPSRLSRPPADQAPGLVPGGAAAPMVEPVEPPVGGES